ncbi:TIGR03643 family protein [Dyadobacter flavalbus]|uniref:TIGR03643 family protein n=2 Tax=Dyadobacter flavalbus TaxID=2579942 RepID=A0A5M8QA61_9BACT|nr:TIGR03643 family protein [Dyadobacter flavalbus]
MPEQRTTLKPEEIDRVIEMAWEDRTPFDVIQTQFGLNEQQIIALMRKEMKPSSFRMWRKRVHGRVTKHMKLSDIPDFRFKSSLQRQITANKISKRT